jgi:DNA-directed RNA polymerase sigma subunit (sigma70/sigma32)
MMNKTLYNLQKNREAKVIASGIVDFLEKKDADDGFRNYVLCNIHEIHKMKNEGINPNDAMEVMLDKFKENLKKLLREKERMSDLNAEIFLLNEEREKVKQYEKRQKKLLHKRVKKNLKRLVKLAKKYNIPIKK